MGMPQGHGHTHHNHDRHEGHVTGDFLTKFWITLVLTIPIFFYSEMADMVFGLHGPEFPGWRYVLLLLGSVVYFYCGLVFIQGAYQELKAKLPGMMTLIAIAITTAYVYSVVSIIFHTGHDLVFELSSLIAIMLLGHWIEMRAVMGAEGALSELAKLLPDTAEVLRNGRNERIALSELQRGDIVLVRPGGKVPADGVVIEGESELNESILTGESKSVMKMVSSEVIAGSINGDGSLKIRVMHMGERTFLAGVMRLIADAQASKSGLQILSDRAALYLTIIALSAGILTFVLWLLADAGVITATERLVAVLVIACPHALGLAVPLVASISTTMAAKNGLLIRQRLALESARNISVVLFDKTGTLTKGEFGVVQVLPYGDHFEVDVVSLAASINSYSEHPLAKAIIQEAAARSIGLQQTDSFIRLPGKGAKARVNGKESYIGSDQLLLDMHIAVSKHHEERVGELELEGKTVNHVIQDGKLVGSIALADVVRPESREAIRSLTALGIHVAMITGDSEEVAQWVAKELGIKEYFSGVVPNLKAEKVKFLQEGGVKVAMVGDGVNDAPALAQADLGIAIGVGTNVALESAGIILVRNDPRDISKIIHLSKLTYVKMIQNLFWAAGYNVVAIPLAAGAFASYGFVLQPAFAAILMSASTVIVAFNAMLLKRNLI